MMKMVLAGALLFAGVSASAYTITDVTRAANVAVLGNIGESTGRITFTPGDTASFSLDMGFIKGTMVMAVKSYSSSELVLTQDADLGAMGKQSCVVKINPSTGKTTSLVCNGQSQDTSSNDGTTIEDETDDTITVPAGTFECIHVTAKTKDGKDLNQWVNPKLVPVGGLIKTVAPGQFGDVTILLTSFKKN